MLGRKRVLIAVLAAGIMVGLFSVWLINRPSPGSGSLTEPTGSSKAEVTSPASKASPNATASPDAKPDSSTALSPTAAYTLKLDGSKPGIAISPTLYGAFFEEINHAGDGGLYAELISNRSFEDNAEYPDNWYIDKRQGAKGTLSLVKDGLLNEAQHAALALQATELPQGASVSVFNNGYWGIGLKAGTDYAFSVYAKRDTKFHGPLTVRLEDVSGKTVFAEASLPELTTEWREYRLTLRPSADGANARLRLTLEQPGTVYLDLVSLFPPTWKNRVNGLRTDLAEKVAAMEPKFLRFPGGCFIEGSEPANAYAWKKTLGALKDRTGHQGYWGYRSTDGLGFHEFLQWAEDLHAAPLYVAYIGISHDGDPFAKANYVPLSGLDPWIQDALDAIEYANGPVTSRWGKVRAANGHPEPFGLKYIEVGNENNFQMSEYVKRYPLFYRAIKAKYPEIEIIANAAVPGQGLDDLDEHYYESPEWFMDNSTRYDTYDRSGPGIYIGEYAATKDIGKGNMGAALGEAAFLTGVERNADIVRMASYAPLFVNDNNRTWNPDAIVFNSEASYGTPSYQVQRLFGANQGDVLIPSTLEAPEGAAVSKGIQGKVGVGTWATQAEFDDLKVISGAAPLLTDDFAAPADGSAAWQPGAAGSWTRTDGVYRQTGGETDVRSIAGDSEWSDYTLTLRARKTGGAEGMLILFGVRDTGTYYWWNLGGWGNTRTAIEKSVGGSKAIVGSESPISIETGRWYDIRIELIGSHIKAYLDGKLIHDVTDAVNRGPLFQTASLDKETGDLIVKLVNVGERPVPVQLQLSGIAVTGSASAEVLEAEEWTDENTFEHPDKVTPRPGQILVQAGTASYEAPRYSVSVLRLRTQP